MGTLIALSLSYDTVIETSAMETNAPMACALFEQISSSWPARVKLVWPSDHLKQTDTKKAVLRLRIGKGIAGEGFNYPTKLVITLRFVNLIIYVIDGVIRNLACPK